MPAPVGQEEEQVGGSQCDQSTWNIQLWIYTSFTAAAAALLLVRDTPQPEFVFKRFFLHSVWTVWHTNRNPRASACSGDTIFG